MVGPLQRWVELLPGLLAVLEVLLGEHVELAVQPARLVPAETTRKQHEKITTAQLLPARVNIRDAAAFVQSSGGKNNVKLGTTAAQRRRSGPQWCCGAGQQGRAGLSIVG